MFLCVIVWIEGLLPWAHLVPLLLVEQSTLVAEDVFTGNLGGGRAGKVTGVQHLAGNETFFNFKVVISKVSVSLSFVVTYSH